MSDGTRASGARPWHPLVARAVVPHLSEIGAWYNRADRSHAPAVLDANYG